MYFFGTFINSISQKIFLYSVLRFHGSLLICKRKLLKIIIMKEIKSIYEWLSITKASIIRLMRLILNESELKEIMRQGYDCIEDLKFVEDYIKELEEKLPF